MTFNPSEHLIKLKDNKDYLPCQWRVVWLREKYPQATIETEELVVDLDREVTVEREIWDKQTRQYRTLKKTARGYARFKATVTDGKGGKATATGSECAADFSEYVEKAETKAIGRALALLGFGTAFTGDELSENGKVVDSPLAR